jgi:hypothetical protein
MNEPEFTGSLPLAGCANEAGGCDSRRRACAHDHRGGARWSDNDDLVFQEPLHDPNVIYNFHFYEPHIFTHQGATWSAYYWHWLRGLKYPSNSGVGGARGGAGAG